MKAIVAVTSDWAIGKDNKLLLSIPEDMKFFRETTGGGTLIMGRKTLESFPGGNPLKGRINIVITRDADYVKEGAIIVHSPEEALSRAAEYTDRECFVIGGESIYRQMIGHCDMAYVTKAGVTADADAFFPDLDNDKSWKVSTCSEEKEYEGIRYRFVTYVNTLRM